MSQFIRTRVWNHLQANRFLHKPAGAFSLSRKLRTSCQQFSDVAPDEQTMGSDTNQALMSIDANQAGRVIGRRGMIIRQLAKVSNCRISVSDYQASDDPTAKRSVSIVGESEHDIAEAKRLIGEVLTNENVFLNESLECEIPISQIGRVVGKDGWNVNALCDKHDCHIRVGQVGNREEGEGNVKVNFFGGLENCTEARNALLQSMEMMNGDDDANGISVAVPEHLRGVLIGKSGATINMLKKLTRCELSFENRESDRDVDASQDQSLIIRGSEEDCADARTVITAILNLVKRHKEAGELV